MATLRVPPPPDIIEDQLRNKFKAESGDLQDGMLAYYQSQLPFTDAYESNVLASEYFDVRDLLKRKPNE